MGFSFLRRCRNRRKTKVSITGQVAAGLTHDPDGGTLSLFTAGGAENKVVLERREGGGVGHGEETWRGCVR